MRDECKICGAPRETFGDATIMGRHQVTYFRCVGCGFIQTEDPYWLAEAYKEAIHETDVGHVARNISTSRVARAVIASGFDRGGRFLDFGGGYGLFVRLMRDAGLDFYRDDPYCANLFAQGFDRTGTGDSGYELVTAFEVAEHFPDPVGGFQEILSRGQSILFSTLLLPDPAPRPGEWWYYSLESGQHVSLYSRTALTELATRFNLSLASSRSGEFHLMTSKRKPLRLFPLTSRRKTAMLISAAFRRGH